MQRVIDWLRAQVERVLRDRAAAAEPAAARGCIPTPQNLGSDRAAAGQVGTGAARGDRTDTARGSLPIPRPTSLRPTPTPPLETRYREHYPDHATDVDRNSWFDAMQCLDDPLELNRLKKGFVVPGSDAPKLQPIPDLPHCLRDTNNPPPPGEPSPSEAMARYEAAMPLGYRRRREFSRYWTPIRERFDRTLDAVDNRLLARNRTPDKAAAEVRDSCGEDARRVHRHIMNDHKTRARTLGIVHRIQKLHQPPRPPAPPPQAPTTAGPPRRRPQESASAEERPRSSRPAVQPAPSATREQEERFRRVAPGVRPGQETSEKIDQALDSAIERFEPRPAPRPPDPAPPTPKPKRDHRNRDRGGGMER